LLQQPDGAEEKSPCGAKGQKEARYPQGLESYIVLRLRSQVTKPSPILPSKMAEGAGIISGSAIIRA